MPLPKIRITDYRKNNPEFSSWSNEELASFLYNKYKNEIWKDPAHVRQRVLRNQIMLDEDKNPIFNIYAGDVSKKEWTGEFLLGKHELSEGIVKDIGRTGAKVSSYS